MKVLTLSIKQKYFDEILSGVKKTEVREIRPNNFARYCRYLHKGIEYVNIEGIPEDDNEIDIIPVKYDAIKLLTGEYKDKRPYIIIAVKDTKIYFLQDEKGEDVIYEVDGKEYIASEIEYELGEVIDKC